MFEHLLGLPQGDAKGIVGNRRATPAGRTRLRSAWGCGLWRHWLGISRFPSPPATKTNCPGASEQSQSTRYHRHPPAPPLIVRRAYKREDQPCPPSALVITLRLLISGHVTCRS